MVLSLDVSYWLTLLLSLPAAGFLVRLFIIQHDCGHGSFFASRKANDLVGTCCSLFTWTPYRYWQKSHTPFTMPMPAIWSIEALATSIL